MATKTLPCSFCFILTQCGDEADSVICGRCAILSVDRRNKKVEEQLGQIDRKRAKTFRKLAGYTQIHMAAHLQIPIHELRAFEQGNGICPAKYAEWLGKEIKDESY
jgi:DNA-binding XRE family transcriptional regulator